MREHEFKTGHVIFKLRYDQIYQMKTTLDEEIVKMCNKFNMAVWVICKIEQPIQPIL